MKDMQRRVFIFDFSGNKTGEMPIRSDETLRIIGAIAGGDELLLETESFTEPIGIFRFCTRRDERTLWAKRNIPFDSPDFSHFQIWFMSKDGTRIPMFLVGRRDVLKRSGSPTIMTSYGGCRRSLTPPLPHLLSLLFLGAGHFSSPPPLPSSEHS